MPIDLAPKEFLELVFCNGTKGYDKKNCSCKRSVIFCSSICGFCQIDNICNNEAPTPDEDQEDAYDNDIPENMSCS